MKRRCITDFSLREGQFDHLRKMSYILKRSINNSPKYISEAEKFQNDIRQNEHVITTREKDVNDISFSDIVNKLKGTVLGMFSSRASSVEGVKYFQWGSSLDENLKTDDNSTVQLRKSTIIASPEKTQQNLHLLTLIDKKQQDLHLLHPIFGELLHDLQYKKVYLTNVKSLMMAPIWEKNRILRPERANRIANSKIKSSVIGLPGVITMFHNNNPKATSSCGIIDGQHRAAALMIMAQIGKWDLNTRNILVEVFPVNEDSDVSDLFREINSGESIRLVDMPGELVDNNFRDMLDIVTSSLKLKFPDMFKPSQNCRLPHVNADVLRDDIFQSDVIKSRGFKNANELEEYLLNVNNLLSKWTDEEWYKNICGLEGLEKNIPETKLKKIDVALKKAKEFKFFLGMTKSWFG